MEKYLKKCLFVLLMALMAVSFTSCGGDDEEEPQPVEENGLVGNWYIADINDVVTFKSNGTYTYYEHVNLTQKTYEDFWDGTYDYNEKTGMLIMYWGGEVDYYIEVKSIVNNTMVVNIHDSDDPSYYNERYCRRISDSEMPTKLI